MCARRFLLMVFIVILVGVAGALAIFQFGDRMLIRSAVPKGHFEAAAAGRAPDYAPSDQWIARPDVADDPSRWRPAGSAGARDPRAAVFYIHPTTYLERDRWNAPRTPGGATEMRTRLFVQSQASALASAGRVWAPRYRQAAYGAFLLDTKDATDALDLAYRDVAAAFDEFLRRNPRGPIILAGHSQGALHLERLLREKVAGKPIASRIVAAYVVGWPISIRADLPQLGLPACHAPSQVRCILSWMSFGDPANPELILGEWKKSKGLTGAERRQRDLLCVNPVSGSEGGAAPPQANPGTLMPSLDLRSATLQRGAVGAHCEKGLLLVDGQIAPLGPYVLPGNNYHVYDFALFWGAIRADAQRRLAAWQP